MAWRETSRMMERREFVLAALAPEVNVSALCAEYGISRKTGYKWIKRFKEQGVGGLEDRSRRPHCSPLRASGEVVLRVLELRREYAYWGPKKIANLLKQRWPQDEAPSLRTVARILERASLTQPRAKRVKPQSVPARAPDAIAQACNDVWTVDFKGWWLAGDGTRCEPLTVRDAYSRYVLVVELVESTGAATVKAVFERLFKEHGLPRVIHVDNGAPFASTRARGGLTTLSAWWVSLGIRVVRGRPAHPQDQGGHERMHLDMRYELEDKAASNAREQQQACDVWRHTFNYVRPHEALGQRTPAEVYVKSPRRFEGPQEPCYPPRMTPRRVSCKGMVKYSGGLLYIGEGLRGHKVGLEPIAGDVLRVFFYDVDLGEVRRCA